MNNTRTHTFSVNGFTLRTRTPRRYAVVTTRATPITDERGTYVAFAEVTKRTDNYATAKTEQRRYGRQNGCYKVVVDLLTGGLV